MLCLLYKRNRKYKASKKPVIANGYANTQWFRYGTLLTQALYKQCRRMHTSCPAYCRQKLANQSAPSRACVPGRMGTCMYVCLYVCACWEIYPRGPGGGITWRQSPRATAKPGSQVTPTISTR